jgi:DNA topoisomerase-3
LGKDKKSPKVLMTKVTDHHAIIPTGIQNNYNTINNKCMIVLLRFIAVFYDDCLVANTTVLGKAADVILKLLVKKFKKGSALF